MAVRPLIPNPSTPLLNQDGTMSQEWYRFFSDVVRPITGWGVVTGALDRSSFDTGVIGHAQLAQIVGTLLTDLRNINRIGS